MRKGATIFRITDDNATVARSNSENVTVAAGGIHDVSTLPFLWPLQGL